MTTRERAALRLGELLATELVGDLVDQVADSEARDLALKLMAHLRGIAVDEESARLMDERERQRQRQHAQALKHVSAPPAGRQR